MSSARPYGSAGFPDDAGLATRAGELLDQIASQPRFAGSESEKKARRLCTTFLEAQGMSVSDQRFLFSEFPGRYGTPIVAAMWLVTALFAIHVYSRHGGPSRALAVLALGLGVSGAIGMWLMRAVMPPFRGKRTESSNLVAIRGFPRVWLVAHLDSKVQTLPMIARIAGLMAAAVAFGLLALSLAVEWLVGGPPPVSGAWSLTPILATVAAATAVPMVLCFVRDTSPGAVDNASGVIAVLLATTLLRAQDDLGVILTSAEELGLAGARSYTQSTRFFTAQPAFEGLSASQVDSADKAGFTRVIALNCDTVDDDGEFLCMVRRSSQSAATSAMVRAAARTRMPLRVRGMIPGILADSIAFSDEGWDSLTLSRGNIATLARVHTSSDTRERLSGTGIAQAAYLLAATVEELR